MKIGRAHSYDEVRLARTWLDLLPAGWEAQLDAAGVEWIILPAGLSPLWTGHALASWADNARAWGYADGIDYGNVGGFLSFDPWGPWERPYIYLNGRYPSSAPHEAAHALERIWRPPLDALYAPDRAVTPYGRSNAAEFFAEAIVAYVLPERYDRLPTWQDLARLDPDLHAYLSSRGGW